MKPALAYLAGVVTAALMLAVAFLLEELAHRREIARPRVADDDLEDPGKVRGR